MTSPGCTILVLLLLLDLDFFIIVLVAPLIYVMPSILFLFS